MATPPNKRIKRFLGPDERPSVLFNATRPLPRASWPAGYVVLWVALEVVGHRFGDGWSLTSVAPLLGIALFYSVSLGPLWRVHYVGVVGDDIVVVRPGLRPGGDRLIGRWSPQAADPAILGSRFIRIRIAGVKYWVESDDAIRARLAVNNLNAARRSVSPV